jgi:hypothetical protein
MIFCCAQVEAQQLKVLKGKTLFYEDSSRVVKIAEVEPSNDDFFQGYDIVDSSTVFFAVSHNAGEPWTSLSLFDIDKKKEHQFGYLGNAFGSFFQYNRDNGFLVFGWENQLYLARLDSVEWSDLTRRGTKLIASVPGGDDMLPFWIDRSTVGYVAYKAGTWDVRTVKIPSE